MDPRATRLLTPFGVIIAVLCFAVLMAVSAPLAVAVIVGVVLGAAFVAYALSRADSMVLDRLAVRESNERDQPRVHNVLDGLCDSHGFRRPQVLIVDDEACNAAAFGVHPKRPRLVLTSGLLDGLDLLPLEALLARELSVLDDDSRPAATAAVALRRWLPRRWGEAIAARVQGRERSIRDDFEAVRFTRYPPGLASALAVMAGCDTAVRGAPRAGAHLWVADPTANAATSDGWDMSRRVDALREL